jgi:hypothetical protein
MVDLLLHYQAASSAPPAATTTTATSFQDRCVSAAAGRCFWPAVCDWCAVDRPAAFIRWRAALVRRQRFDRPAVDDRCHHAVRRWWRMSREWNPITTALVVTNNKLARSHTAPKARPAAAGIGMRRCAMVCAKFQSVLGITIIRRSDAGAEQNRRDDQSWWHGPATDHPRER